MLLQCYNRIAPRPPMLFGRAAGQNGLVPRWSQQGRQLYIGMIILGGRAAPPDPPCYSAGRAGHSGAPSRTLNNAQDILEP